MYLMAVRGISIGESCTLSLYFDIVSVPAVFLLVFLVHVPTLVYHRGCVITIAHLRQV